MLNINKFNGLKSLELSNQWSEVIGDFLRFTKRVLHFAKEHFKCKKIATLRCFQVIVHFREFMTPNLEKGKFTLRLELLLTTSMFYCYLGINVS